MFSVGSGSNGLRLCLFSGTSGGPWSSKITSNQQPLIKPAKMHYIAGEVSGDHGFSDIIETIRDMEEMDKSSAGAGVPDGYLGGDQPGCDDKPYVTIVEQPASNEARFRYKCEGRSAGSIPGASSSKDHKTSPTIQINNYRGQAVVVVSCVTKDKPYRPHPHNLVGKEGCKDGICTVKIASNEMVIQFPNLGIQCVKKNEVENSLRQREAKQLDPFRTGFDHATQPSSIDLNVVRLCFQVFLPGSNPECFDKPLTPVVSQPIFDKKSVFDLQIHRLSHASAPVGGGLEMILLCEKVTKEDIEIRFYERIGGQIVWQGKGDFQPINVHKQVAITFRTPVYKTKEVENPVNVQIELYRPSDNASSKPVDFVFTPLDSDLKRKRTKTSDASKQLPVFEDTRMSLRTSPDPVRYPVKQEPTESANNLFANSVAPIYGNSMSPLSVPALSPHMPVGRTPSPIEYQTTQNAALGPYDRLTATACQTVFSAPRMTTQVPIKLPNMHAGGTFTSYTPTSPVYHQQDVVVNDRGGAPTGQQTYSNFAPLPIFSSLTTMPAPSGSDMSGTPSTVGSLGMFGITVDSSISPPAPEACPVTDINIPASTLNVPLNSEEFASVSYWDSQLSDQISSNLNLSEEPERQTAAK